MWCATILIVATTVRLALILFAQTDAGDSSTYELFAKNILRGCGLSYSDPSSDQCDLTTGGNFPGYPFFIASAWLLFGKSIYTVLLLQLACYVLALNWLLIAIMRLTNCTKVMIAVGMLLALSPLQVGWFRYILTEPLALATATWFLAELLISVAIRKVRIFQLALALSIAIYIRLDSVFMILGACLISFYIYDFKKSIKKILIIVLLTTIPLSGWMIRNYTVNKTLLGESTAGQYSPGYFMWLDTWVVNEYERSDTFSPAWIKEYSKIKIHNSRYISDDELVKAQLLLSELSMFDSQKIPTNIDSQFYALAEKKISTRNIFIKIQIYAERAFWLVLNPFSSWGLPFEIRAIDRSEVSKAIKNNDLVKVNEILSKNKGMIFGKISSFIYRLLIFLTFTFLVIITILKSKLMIIKKINIGMREIVKSTMLVMSARIIFFIFLGYLESRYLVEAIPWVEFCCMYWFVRRF